MRTRLLYGIILAFTFAIILASQTYCASLTIDPPGTSTTGSLISITGAIPLDPTNNWKEAPRTYKNGGSYCNQLNFTPGGSVYSVSISLAAPLLCSSNGKTIPVSNMRYMLSYVNIYDSGASSSAAGAGTYASGFQKYQPFSLAPTVVYTSTVAESAATKIGQSQFLFAILVPDNQAPGTYTGTIYYQVGLISGSTPISVQIGSVFTLSADRGTADFTTMKPGETKDNVPPEGIIITSKTNDGNPWFLKISDTSPLSAGPYVIPNSNLIWYGWSDGKGTWYGNGTNAFTFVPSLMYASSMTETNNLPDGTNNHLKLKLTIPPGQPGGKYISTIQLTMTE